MIVALLLVIIGLMFPPALFVIVPGAVLYVACRMLATIGKTVVKAFDERPPQD